MSTDERIAVLESRVQCLEERVARLNCRLNSAPAAGMQGTVLHTSSDPAGTPLGELPIQPPTPPAGAESRYSDDRLVNPGPPQPDPLAGVPDYEPTDSLTAEEILLRQKEREAEGK